MNFVELEDEICVFEQTTAILGFIQTAFAEGSTAVNNGEAAEALMFLYMKQGDAIKNMKQFLVERKAVRQYE